MKFSHGLIGAACLLGASGVLASSGTASAQRPGMFAAASAPFAKRLAPEQREEWRFLKDAAAAGRFEAEAARGALAKSGDANVRSLAAALVNHHASAQAALLQMLRSRDIAPPMLANDQRKVLNRLAKLQGAKFDREWMEAVALRSQQDDVLAFEKAAGTARDPRLRAWIERTLPTLRWQLASAQRAAAGGTKYATLAPLLPQAAIKSPAPAAADLGEGNMLLGPARSVAVKLTEPNTR